MADLRFPLGRLQPGRDSRFEAAGSIGMDDPRRGGLVELLDRRAKLGLSLLSVAGLGQLKDLPDASLQFRLGRPIPGTTDEALTQTLSSTGNIGHGDLTSTARSARASFGQDLQDYAGFRINQLDDRLAE